MGTRTFSRKSTCPFFIQIFIRTLRRVLAGSEDGGLAERVNALLLAPEGRRDWPLRFYSAELLFSTEARLGWVEPDLAALPVA